MTNHSVAKKLKDSHFSRYYMILVLKAWSEACVMASHESLWGFLVLLWPKEVLSTSKWQHIWFWVQTEGRWTRKVFISVMGGGYQGVTGNRETHFREINQSLDEQDCHFLYECWKISMPLILVCCVFGFYQLCINRGKCSRGIFEHYESLWSF